MSCLTWSAHETGTRVWKLLKTEVNSNYNCSSTEGERDQKLLRGLEPPSRLISEGRLLNETSMQNL